MLLAIRESGPIAARQVTVLRLAQGAAFDVSGDVALNTTHRAGDGSDHADVALNTAHSQGDGADHADVAFNSAFIDPEGYNNTPLKAVLDLADIISIETSTGGVFSKVKATLQILKDLIGGGGGGGEWTEIDRTVITAPATDVEFIDKITDDYDIYRISVYGLTVSTGTGTPNVGIGTGLGTPTWRTNTYFTHLSKPNSISTGYLGDNFTNGFPAAQQVGVSTISIDFKMEVYNLRRAIAKGYASNGTSYSGGLGVQARGGGSCNYTDVMDAIRLRGGGATLGGGTVILEGKVL